MSTNDQLQTSPVGLDFISHWEGCVLKPYKDIAGLRTIGVGHLIKPNENFPDGVSITKDAALQLLAADVKLCENAIKKAITVPLTQNQFDALVSFGFNCGVGVYSTSGACKALNTGDYNSVPVKLLDWSKARVNGVMTVNQGLYKRRTAEGELFAKVLDSSMTPSAPPPPVTVAWDKSTLTEAQTILKKLGLYTIKVDGFWGPSTSKAISSFAANSGLSVGSDIQHQIPSDLLSALRDAGK